MYAYRPQMPTEAAEARRRAGETRLAKENIHTMQNRRAHCTLSIRPWALVVRLGAWGSRFTSPQMSEGALANARRQAMTRKPVRVITYGLA